jgi:hypothetical protein
MRALDGPAVSTGNVLPGCAGVHAEHPVRVEVASTGGWVLHAAPPLACACLLARMYLLAFDESRKLESALVKRPPQVLYT